MLTEEQKKLITIAKTGRNIFLSGGAGTGKSYVMQKLISELRKEGKKVLVTAPTGIAAIHVGGATLHRTFQIPFGPCPELKGHIPKEILFADVIIIDEISMCRADVFDYVANVILKTEVKEKKTIQLIVCGDFCQLPPVVANADAECLSSKYEGFYAFESASWEMFDFLTILLKDIIRQEDKDFARMLNDIRVGKRAVVGEIYAHSNKNPIKDAITLYATNKKADERNLAELHKLNAPITKFTATISGQVNKNEEPVPEEIQLAVGARVMFAINDSEERFANGTFGIVTAVRAGFVKVKIDDGPVVDIYPFEWTINKYTVKRVPNSAKEEIITEKIGSFSQIPLRLAYAITMHKSQGQTYEKVNLDPYCFAEGQFYVALSRVKTIDNLHFLVPPKTEYLITDLRVQDLYKNIAK